MRRNCGRSRTHRIIGTLGVWVIYDGNIEYGRCCLLLRHTIFTFVLRLCTRNRKGYARMLMYKPAPTGRKTTVERAAGGRRKRKDRSMRPIDADVLKESFVAQIDYYKNIVGITVTRWFRHTKQFWKGLTTSLPWTPCLYRARSAVQFTSAGSIKTVTDGLHPALSPAYTFR